MADMARAAGAAAVGGWRFERIGSAVAGAALIASALRGPSFLRTVAVIGGAILLQRGVAGRGAARPPDRRVPSRNDAVLCASEDSFPASDPPAWTPVTGTRAAD